MRSWRSVYGSPGCDSGFLGSELSQGMIRMLLELICDVMQQNSG